MSAYRNETRVSLRYELDRDDYLRAMRSERRRGGAWLRLAGVLGVICAVLGGLMLVRLGPMPAALGTGIVSGLMALFMAYSFRLPIKQLDARFDDYREQRLDVSEDAFEVHDRTSGKRVAWDLVLHWRETDDAFLVFVTTQRFHVIPKRLLPSPEVATTLRQLLAERVPPGGEERVQKPRVQDLFGPLFALGVVATLLGAFVELLLSYAF